MAWRFVAKTALFVSALIALVIFVSSGVFAVTLAIEGNPLEIRADEYGGAFSYRYDDGSNPFFSFPVIFVIVFLAVIIVMFLFWFT